MDVIEKQRPLKLQESLKKATAGIRKDRVARARERLGVCDASQFAFFSGRSTVQPAMTKMLLLRARVGARCLWTLPNMRTGFSIAS